MNGHRQSTIALSLTLRLEHEMRDLVSRLRGMHHAGEQMEDGIALIDEVALRMANARALAEQQEATLRCLLDRNTDG